MGGAGWILAGRPGRLSAVSRSGLRPGRRYLPPGSSLMARRLFSLERILNRGRVSVFLSCKAWAISFAEAGSLLSCRKRNMLSGWRDEELGIANGAKKQAQVFRQDCSHFFGSTGTFF